MNLNFSANMAGFCRDSHICVLHVCIILYRRNLCDCNYMNASTQNVIECMYACMYMHACMLATCVLQACYMHATLIMHFTCIQHHYTMHVYQTCMYMLCNMHVTCITFRVGLPQFDSGVRSQTHGISVSYIHKL